MARQSNVRPQQQNSFNNNHGNVNGAGRAGRSIQSHQQQPSRQPQYQQQQPHGNNQQPQSHGNNQQPRNESRPAPQHEQSRPQPQHEEKSPKEHQLNWSRQLATDNLEGPQDMPRAFLRWQ